MSVREILSDVPANKVAIPLDTFVLNSLDTDFAYWGMPTKDDHIHDRVVLVAPFEGDRSAIGWIDLARLDGSEDEIDWQPFESRMLISSLCNADTCLQILLRSSDEFCFLVGDRGISGIVTYWSIINSEAFALSVMQSIFEFERSMVQSLWNEPGKIIAVVNERLRRGLEKSFRDNFGEVLDPTPGDLVLSGSFGQRIRMFISAVHAGLFDMQVARKKMKSLLCAAQDLRNLYAHPEHVGVRPVWIDPERLKWWMKEWDAFRLEFDQLEVNQHQEPITLARWAKIQAEKNLRHEVREPRFSRIKSSRNG